MSQQIVSILSREPFVYEYVCVEVLCSNNMAWELQKYYQSHAFLSVKNKFLYLPRE